MKRCDINIIADDYGISPGVSDAIRVLMSCAAITGTSCLTLFPDWMDQADLLRQLTKTYAGEIGLHLALTDFKPLSGFRDGKPMLPLASLLISSLTGLTGDDEVHEELDAQLDRFIDGVGRLPDFIDGHQHVHFLPAVRRWLETRRKKLEAGGRSPWLRGAPSSVFSGSLLLHAKVSFVQRLAHGFDQQMSAARFEVRGPLAGFYNWQRADQVAATFRAVEGTLPKGAVLMCHPGWIDDTLVGRDRMVRARPLEFDALMQRV